jgi:predicted small secreted protein
MTKKHGICFGLIVILVTIMFALAGCDNGTTSGAGLDDFPDAYSHATNFPAMSNPGALSKEILTGEKHTNALKFLEDSSHYIYTQKDLQYFKDYVHYENGFDEDWRSSVNGRVYRGPYYDPLSRSVCWLSINPNGAVSVSLGSYWALIPPGKDLPADEAHGYVKSDKPQIMSYNSTGQMTQNWIERHRGTFAIDASLAEHYGVPGARYFFVEVKLNHYEKRVVTPQEFYDGLIPESWSMGVNGQWAFNDSEFLSFDDFWGKSEKERAEYIAKANDDPVVREILANTGGYFWFDIMQIVSVADLIGFEYESENGKVNGIDVNHDGYLDKYPAGHAQAGELILSGGPRRVPEYALYLNYNDAWWFDNRSVPGTIRVVYADGTEVPDPR